VHGAALLLAHEMPQLGPAGKVMVTYLVSLLTLGAGVFYERRDRYRVLSRGAIGGGGALIFATTYAMYHFQAPRVLHSEALDFLLLLLVAACMLSHSLQYRSQVTGPAFLMGFFTVTITHVPVSSLAVNGIVELSRRGLFLRRAAADACL
jgi:Predicted membrane protein (DUF2339)